jgi:branched-subunit amino acid transport protein
VSDLGLILVVAIVTYLSRAAAVVLLPAAQGVLLQYVSRLPAPLFAGLAVFTLLGEGVALPEPAALAAAIAALLVTPRRSLGLTLAAGIVGYLVVSWIW